MLSLEAGTVHLWCIDLLQPPYPFSFYANLVSPEEIERAKRFYFEKDQMQFIIGRGTLRHLISRYTSVPSDKIRFDYNAFGKPAFQHSSDLRFNLSHSGGLAVAAFTRKNEIGVDLEKIREDIKVLQIARNFFAPEEREKIARLPEAEQIAAFFQCWTSKEAFIKAHGEGLSLPLDQFEVEARPGFAPGLKLVQWDRELVKLWDLRGFVPRDGFVGAVACAGRIERVHYFS